MAARIDRTTAHVVSCYVGLVLMNLIDWLYTEAALHGGNEEANPVMLYVLQEWGLAGIAVWKGFFLLLLAVFLPRIIRDQFLRGLLYVATLVYSGLTVYHVMWYYLW